MKRLIITASMFLRPLMRNASVFLKVVVQRRRDRSMRP